MWHDTPALLMAGIAGLALGAFFFGGLWWTVLKSLSSRQPGLWQFTSLMVRMGLTLVGFYLVGGGQWQRLLACLLGFVVARLLVVRLTGMQTQGGDRAPQP